MTETTRLDAVVEAVRADLHRRSQLGITKYGTTLCENGASHRERLQHAYEEALDLANYLKWAMMQIDGEAPERMADTAPVLPGDAEMPAGWRCDTWYSDRVAWAVHHGTRPMSATGSSPTHTEAMRAAAQAARYVEAHSAGLAPNPVEDMRARKDAAYEERNRVVAALAKLFPSGLKRTWIEGWDPEWHGCVYVDLPTGQVSWHYHDSHAHLFEGLPAYGGEWDGHDTGEKYARLAGLWPAHAGQHPEIARLLVTLSIAGRRFHAAKHPNKQAGADLARLLREMATGIEKVSGGSADPETPCLMLEASRQAVTLAECPVGLFLAEGDVLGIKTEYATNQGRIEAYIVETGEAFWGASPQTIPAQRASLVRPVTAV